MIPYQRRRNSGVLAYDFGIDSIQVQFRSGRHRNYLYKAEKIGQNNINQMIALAKRGYGLNSFIMRNPSIKNGYSKKW